MTAPDLTGEERATVDRFEAAPACAESWEARVETAARAMHEVPGQPGVYGRIPWDRLLESHRDAYRAMVRAAAAALASVAPETDGLRERIEALADAWDKVADTWQETADHPNTGPKFRVACIDEVDNFRSRAHAVRAALASHTPGGEE